MQGNGNVLVVGEAGADGSPRPISWEMLTAARQVASELGSGNVTGLFIGAGIADAARTWASGGADRVMIADDEGFAGLMPSLAAAALTRAIASDRPGCRAGSRNDSRSRLRAAGRGPARRRSGRGLRELCRRQMARWWQRDRCSAAAR